MVLVEAPTVSEGAAPHTTGASPQPAASGTEKEATMATQTAEIDDQALALRRESKGFGRIAETLGFLRANDANEAFNRALRRQTPEEQATIRSEENGRLDRLRDAVASDTKRTKEEIAKRLRAIERLRGRLMSD